jgi:uncharacterized membrane protein YheB (UPF0754 family)
MTTWQLASLPLLGALIGWLTNWLAVKMIFRPRTRRTILFLTFEGLLPRRRSQIAQSVADTVERDLVPIDKIQEQVRKLAGSPEVRKLLHERIDSLLGEQIKKLGPLAASFLGGDILRKIEERIEGEILTFLADLSDKLHDGLARELDIKDMVRSRIEGFDLDKLEQIVQRIAQKELRHIVVLGGVLGFLVGVAESALLFFTS